MAKGDELKALIYEDMEALRDPVAAIEEDIAKLLSILPLFRSPKHFLPIAEISQAVTSPNSRHSQSPLTSDTGSNCAVPFVGRTKKDLRSSVHGSVASRESLEFAWLRWQSFLDAR